MSIMIPAQILDWAIAGLKARQKQVFDEFQEQINDLLAEKDNAESTGTTAKRPYVRRKSAPAGKKRVISPEARKRIAAAQKKRWAEYRKKQKGEA